LTRQESKRLLDRLAEGHPKLVEELVPKVLSLGEVQKFCSSFCGEQVSVRDLPHHPRSLARLRRLLNKPSGGIGRSGAASAGPGFGEATARRRTWG